MRFGREYLLGVLDVGVDVREESQHPLVVSHQRDVSRLVDKQNLHLLSITERWVEPLDRDLRITRLSVVSGDFAVDRNEPLDLAVIELTDPLLRFLETCLSRTEQAGV